MYHNRSLFPDVEVLLGDIFKTSRHSIRLIRLQTSRRLDILEDIRGPFLDIRGLGIQRFSVHGSFLDVWGYSDVQTPNVRQDSSQFSKLFNTFSI